jgi:2-polyprenyl-3-methyl-5-hydroxy-6-metoxy-1,4-benzoquinol methylase
MLSPQSVNNTQKNQQHYDKRYSNVNINKVLRIARDVNKYLDVVAESDTSWVCMYYDGFREKVKGKKILELGCGNCFNAAVMAALGAQVYANDISDRSGDII